MDSNRYRITKIIFKKCKLIFVYQCILSEVQMLLRITLLLYRTSYNQLKIKSLTHATNVFRK